MTHFSRRPFEQLDTSEAAHILSKHHARDKAPLPENFAAFVGRLGDGTSAGGSGEWHARVQWISVQ